MARPGLPVTTVGFGYAIFGVVYVRGLPSLQPIDWLVIGMYGLLALWIIYGGFRLSDRGQSLQDGGMGLAATMGFGLIGLVVAAALIALQFRRGVEVVDIWFVMLSASVTTGAIGAALALYHLDRRAQQSRLTAQAETVSALNKQLNVLQRVLRHNLRNELTIILGHAELLLDSEPEPEVERSLRTLIKHVQKVGDLSENAYLLRQVWSEDAVVEQELTELLEDCVREAIAEHPEVDINLELPARAPARVHPRFKLAVTEALDNAIEHNDPESLRIAVRVRRLEGASPSVEVVVADTGRGIPEFESHALEQVEESPLDHTTGLGLWLMYWIVGKSGGEVSFEPNEPRGTVVRMTLPGVGD